MAKVAAAEVGCGRRRVRVQELVHRVERGLRRLHVDRWDAEGFKDLDKLVDGGGCHGGGEEIINN